MKVPEVKIGCLHSQVSLECKPHKDARANCHKGKEATANGYDDQGQGCLVMHLVNVDVNNVDKFANTVLNLKWTTKSIILVLINDQKAASI